MIRILESSYWHFIRNILLIFICMTDCGLSQMKKYHAVKLSYCTDVAFRYDIIHRWLVEKSPLLSEGPRFESRSSHFFSLISFTVNLLSYGKVYLHIQLNTKKIVS